MSTAARLARAKPAKLDRSEVKAEPSKKQEEAEEPRCVLCGAFEVALCCGKGHYCCSPCRAAYTRAHEKLCVTATPTCPVIECISPFVVGSEVKPEPRFARMERVASTHPDCVMAVALFGKTSPANWVTEVYRVSNPPLQALFEACRARMAKEGRRLGSKDVGANEIQAWHATPRAAAGGIIREGFNVSRAGSAAGTVLGIGIYVAPNSSFSHMYSREDATSKRCMILCRVLLGDTSGRDSVTDGAASPAQYCVRRECQVMPQFVLYYQAAA